MMWKCFWLECIAGLQTRMHRKTKQKSASHIRIQFGIAIQNDERVSKRQSGELTTICMTDQLIGLYCELRGRDEYHDAKKAVIVD